MERPVSCDAEGQLQYDSQHRSLASGSMNSGGSGSNRMLQAHLLGYGGRKLLLALGPKCHHLLPWSHAMSLQALQTCMLCQDSFAKMPDSFSRDHQCQPIRTHHLHASSAKSPRQCMSRIWHESGIL